MIRQWMNQTGILGPIGTANSGARKLHCRFMNVLVTTGSFVLSAIAQQPILKVRIDRPIAKVSPDFCGLMTEEVNYSYDL